MNTEPENRAAKESQDPLPIRKRFLLFQLTYVFAALIVVLIAIAIDAANSNYRSNDFLYAFLFFFPAVIIFLPWGILPALEWISNQVFGTPLILLNNQCGPAPCTANIFASVLVGLSYILSIGLPIAGVRANRQRIFQRIYLVFVSWVIINAGGCLVHPPS